MITQSNYGILSKEYSLVKTPESHQGSVLTIIELSNGLIASGSADNTIKIWDPNFNYELVKTLEGHQKIVYKFIQLSNGMLTSASNDNMILIWNPNDKYKIFKTLEGHKAGILTFIQLSNGMIASDFRKLKSKNSIFKGASSAVS